MTGNLYRVDQLKGIDYADALERFAGNEALYKRIACKFLNETNYEGLVRALDAGNIEEAYREAHSLKGAAGNLSFVRVYQAAADIAYALHHGDVTTAYGLMPELHEAYAEVRTSLHMLENQ